MRTYLYRCESGHEFGIEVEGSVELPTTCQSKPCKAAAKWVRIIAGDSKLPNRAERVRTSELVGETPKDQAVLNLINRLKRKVKDKERPEAVARVHKDKGYDWRMEQSQRKAGGDVKNGDARLVGEVSTEFYCKMVRESGDEQYWTRNPIQALERHGLLVKRRR